jgi:hypothetical protein
MTARWFVLDTDEGVRGVYSTRRDALADFLYTEVYQRRSYGPGAFEYRWSRPGEERGYSFFLERLPEDTKEWDWAMRAWVAAGRPMGKLTTPCGRVEVEDA